MSKVSKNFDIREFVSPAVWKRFGRNSRWFVNPWCIEMAQFIKDYLTGEYEGEVTVVINNWHYGGNRKWSCHRTYQYVKAQIEAGIKTATLSQHIGGQASAFDFKAYIDKKEIPAADIRARILKHQSLMMSHGLTTIEGDKWAKTWCHLDNRFTGLDHILIVGT